MMKASALLAAMLAFSMNAAPATADNVLHFSYTLANGHVLGGTLFGTLLADNNTFDIGSPGDSITYDGNVVFGPYYPDYFGSIDPQSIGHNTPYFNHSGVVTLDGSMLDLYDSNLPYMGTNTGFALIVNAAAYPGSDVVDTFGSAFGGTSEMVFVRSNWSASVEGVTTSVPEPATWAMMLIGFSGIGFAMRRRGTAKQQKSPF